MSDLVPDVDTYGRHGLPEVLRDFCEDIARNGIEPALAGARALGIEPDRADLRLRMLDVADALRSLDELGRAALTLELACAFEEAAA